MKLNVGELIKKVTSEKSGTRILVAIGTAGLCIIMLSSVFTGSSDDKKVKDEGKKDSISFCIETEKKLEKFICALEGVSEAEVLITLGSDEELVFAKEGRTIITDEKKEEEKQYVMVGANSGKSALVETVRTPEINGIAVAYSGNNSAAVREAIYKSVSTALNIPTSRIYVTLLK
ncbi:MAG: hypothetical protein IJN05_06535 [Ruminococcus sp.]|nr:hypothetical protein [Ruminococcus sp.]MBR4023545.1 hypothetical protein [Ruminococcus sp.]